VYGVPCKCCTLSYKHEFANKHIRSTKYKIDMYTYISSDEVESEKPSVAAVETAPD